MKPLALLPLLVIAAAAPTPIYVEQRAAMVARIRAQLETDTGMDATERERVLAIVGRTPREKFVLKAARGYAYVPAPLLIGYGQTISDAYVVTIMTAALRLPSSAEVLDIGTGSGYQAAILSPLARRVSSIEIVKPLADKAAKRLRKLGYRNVEVRAGDGFAGWPDHAPFDGIVVAAGAAEIPKPLLDQLKPGGRLVMPIGPSIAQEQLIVVRKAQDGATSTCSFGPTMFVPLTGRGERSPTLRGLYDRSIPRCDTDA